MSLLQLLGLLLVPLFHLLLSRFVPGLFCYSLMILLLFLLELLPFLLLLLLELLLLLLEFLVGLRLSCIGGMFERGEILGVHWSGGAVAAIHRATTILATSSSSIRGRIIRGSGFAGRYGFAAVERSRPGRRSDRRLAAIGGRPQLRISTGSLHMLNLSGGRREMPLMSGSFLFPRWTGVNPTGAAVVANPIHRRGVVDDRRVIDIVNHGYVHVGDRTVVEEMVVVPASSLEVGSPGTELEFAL